MGLQKKEWNSPKSNIWRPVILSLHCRLHILQVAEKIKKTTLIYNFNPELMTSASTTSLERLCQRRLNFTSSAQFEVNSKQICAHSDSDFEWGINGRRRSRACSLQNQNCDLEQILWVVSGSKDGERQAVESEWWNLGDLLVCAAFSRSLTFSMRSLL